MKQIAAAPKRRRFRHAAFESRTRIPLTFLMVLLCAWSTVFTEEQNDAIGFTSNHVFHGALKGENVDVLSGNINLSIPLGPRYQLNDWFGYQVVLYYNSKIWDTECDPNLPSCPGELSGPDHLGQGFNIHFGRVYHHPKDDAWIYRYQTPDGSDHHFCYQGPNCGDEESYSYDPASIYVVSDGAGGWIAYPGDGTRVRLTKQVTGELADGVGWYATRVETIADIDGDPLTYDPQHYFNINHGAGAAIDTITDSANRTIQFLGSSGGGGVEIRFPWIGGTTTSYWLDFDSSEALEHPSYFYNPVNAPDPVNRALLTGIRLPLPNPQIGEQYTFDYTPNSSPKWGYLTKWILPTGAEVRYFYTHYKTSDRKPYHISLYRRELRFSEMAYHWTYSRSELDALRVAIDNNLDLPGAEPFYDPYYPWWNPDKLDPVNGQGLDLKQSNPGQVWVLDPFTNLTVYYYHYTGYASDGSDCDAVGCKTTWTDGLLYRVEQYAGPVKDGGRLVRRENYIYTYDDIRKTRTPSTTPSTVGDMARNSRRSESEVETPGSGGYPTRSRREVSTDWTTGQIRRAKMILEYDGAELYRKTIREYNPSPSREFHDAYSSSTIEDAAGQVVSCADLSWAINRLTSETRRTDCSISATQPEDVYTSNFYDPGTGNLMSTTVSGGDGGQSTTTRYTYTNDDVLATNTNGVVATKTIDGIGWELVDRTVDPASGMVTSSRDPADNQTDYAWDGLGRLTGIIPSGPEAPVAIHYDDLHTTRVRQEVTPADYTEETYLYDDLGRVIEERRRTVSGGSYDFRRSEFDIESRLQRQSEWARQGTPDAQLAWTEYDYTTFSNPNAGEPGHLARFTDPLGRVRRVTTPDGGVTDTQYEGLSRRVTVYGVAGPNGTTRDPTTIYLDDPFGRLVQVDSADGADAVYEYDELDNLTLVTLVDPNPTAGTTQYRFFDYDTLGRLRFATNPENGTVEYEQYDARGNLLRYRDAAGSTFVNTYDNAGRITNNQMLIGSALVDLVVNEYDSGSVDGETFDAGAASGRLTRQRSYEVVGEQSTLVTTRKFRYGNSNASCVPTTNIQEPAYVGLNGRLESSTVSILPWGQELETSFCYNELGLPFLTKYPDASGSTRTRAEVGLLYSNGLLNQIRDLSNRDLTYVWSVDYGPHGSPTYMQRGNGVRTNIPRDSLGRPLQFQVQRYDVTSGGGGGGSGEEGEECTPGPIPEQCGGGGSGTTGSWTTLWDTGAYVYDLAGNIAGIGTDTFAYDDLTRLTNATINKQGNNYVMTYAFDAFGNMTNRKKNTNGSLVETPFLVDPATNRLYDLDIESNPVNLYDPNGNLTIDGDRRNVFDERNRLIEVWDRDNNLVASYDYDANGYRVRSVVDGIETYFVRDESGGVLSEFRRGVGATDPAGWDKDYIYGVGQAVSMVKNELPGTLAKPWATVTDGQPNMENGLTLNWEASTESDVQQYLVVRWASSGGNSDVSSYVTGTTWVDDFSGVPGGSSVKVYYRVHAVDGAWNLSDPSPKLTVEPRGGPPPEPTDFNLQGLDRAIRVSWDPMPTVADLQGIEIERRIGGPGSPWVLITLTPVVGTEFLDVGLTNGLNPPHHYRIRAVDTSGQTSSTTVSKSTYPRDDVAPGKPNGLTAQAGFAPGTIRVSWNPVADYDLDFYWVQVSGCGTNGVALTPEFESTGLTPEVDCTYQVESVDTSGNRSGFSDPVTARARSWHAAAVDFNPDPELTRFGAIEICAQPETPPCPGPTDQHNCGILSESDDLLGAELAWSASTDTNVYGYRIYRAPGQTADYVPIADVIGKDSSSYVDTAVNGHEYTYQLVTLISIPGGGVQEILPCASPPCDGVYLTDPYDSDAAVRNLIARDGGDDYSTDNARSRRIEVKWSRVMESQLQGYHVYRKCSWALCEEGWGTPSMDTFACENSWMRLTEVPIVGSEVYTDTTAGGLGGCMLYAVRPVGPPGEGPIRKILSVQTAPHLDDNLNCAAQTTTFTERDKVFSWDINYEINRVNDATRGTGDPTGAPATPANVGYSLGTKTYPGVPLNGPVNAPSQYAQITFDANTESDLRGYHIEMAGSYYGPWKRITKHPVAWWETNYEVRGLAFDALGSNGFVGATNCLAFRVIAVDEDGNESAPGYKIFYDAQNNPTLIEPGCGSSPTAPAPTNLTVVRDSGGATCDVLVEWDQDSAIAANPSLYQYRVYRLVVDRYAFYFYRTDVVPATSCVSGRCSYVERGDSPVSGRDSDPNLDCPYYPDASCGTTGTQAFYVTVQGPSGGESPRSSVVFWDCGMQGYARLHSPTEDYETILLAMEGQQNIADKSTCPVDLEVGVLATLPFSEIDIPADVPSSTVTAYAEPATSPLLKLGQVGGDPPYEVIDLHVDHLGSTRYTTDEAGQRVAEHDFLPFGEEVQPLIVGIDESTKRFTGHERDRETGLDYMLARYYAAGVSRFLSVDPVEGSVANPQSWNRYAYVENQPINYLDPTGRSRMQAAYEEMNPDERRAMKRIGYWKIYLIGMAREKADAETRKRFTEPVLDDFEGNAFRHATWACEAACDAGWQEAWLFTDAHETGDPSNTPERAAMDFWNNYKGIEYSQEPGVCESRSGCATRVDEGLKAGELQTHPPKPGERFPPQPSPTGFNDDDELNVEPNNKTPT